MSTETQPSASGGTAGGQDTLTVTVTPLVAPQTGGLPVLSYQEVTSSDVTIETVGVVRALDPISA